MLNKEETEQFFKNMEQKYSQLLEDADSKNLDECAEPFLSVEEIQRFTEEFNLPLETVRRLTCRQSIYLSVEIDERDSEKEIPFDLQQKIDDLHAEVQNAGGFIEWAMQRKRNKAQQKTAVLLPKDKYR